MLHAEEIPEVWKHQTGGPDDSKPVEESANEREKLQKNMPAMTGSSNVRIKDAQAMSQSTKASFWTMMMIKWRPLSTYHIYLHAKNNGKVVANDDAMAAIASSSNAHKMAARLPRESASDPHMYDPVTIP